MERENKLGKLTNIANLPLNSLCLKKNTNTQTILNACCVINTTATELEAKKEKILSKKKDHTWFNGIDFTRKVFEWWAGENFLKGHCFCTKAFHKHFFCNISVSI